MLIEGLPLLFTDKPPPTLTGLRKWEIPDTTPNGTVIQTLSATLLDSPDEEFEYGLEQSLEFSDYRQPLPFDVIPKTGEVFTNQSLIKLVSQNKPFKS